MCQVGQVLRALKAFFQVADWTCHASFPTFGRPHVRLTFIPAGAGYHLILSPGSSRKEGDVVTLVLFSGHTERTSACADPSTPHVRQAWSCWCESLKVPRSSDKRDTCKGEEWLASLWLWRMKEGMTLVLRLRMVSERWCSREG